MPSPLTTADVDQEIAQNRLAQRRVRHLRVELQSEDRRLAMPDGGDRTGVGAGQSDEVRGDAGDLIPVAHPDIHFVGHPSQQRVIAA